MAGFVQIIEFQSSRIEEIRAVAYAFRDERQAAGDDGAASVRAVYTADRDRPGYYFSIVEFESHDEAMANSGRPETSRFAARMAELCDGPPRFYNLDVIETAETLRS